MANPLFSNEIYAKLALKPYYHAVTPWEQTLEDWCKELEDPVVDEINSALSDILRDTALEAAIKEGRRKLSFGFPIKCDPEPCECFTGYPTFLYTFCKGLQIVPNDGTLPQNLQCDAHNGRTLVYFDSCTDKVLAASYLRATHTGDSIRKSLEQSVDATLRIHVA
jgi:hypothetical protein